MSETLCIVNGCDRPSDGWFVCKSCGENLRDILDDMADWLLRDLNLVETGQTRYAAPQRAGSGDEGVSFNARAAEVRGSLVIALDRSASDIAQANGWERDYRTPSGCARWLAQRITSIRLHPEGSDIVESLSGWYDDALWVVDRPAPKSYLGNCTVSQFAPDDTYLVNPIPCPGRIYAKGQKPEARCDVCGWTYDADQLRANLLGQLDDRFVTAAEFAHLATYLGLPLDRIQVRKRINQWHSRGQVERRNLSDLEAAPTFRFADLLALIYREQQRLDDTRIA